MAVTGVVLVTVRFTCPGCDNSVLISETRGGLIANDMSFTVGCDNTEEHDDGEKLVMWPDDDN